MYELTIVSVFLIKKNLLGFGNVGMVVRHGGDWPLRTSFDGAQDDRRTRVLFGVEGMVLRAWRGLAFAHVLRRSSG